MKFINGYYKSNVIFENISKSIYIFAIFNPFHRRPTRILKEDSVITFMDYNATLHVVISFILFVEN